MSGVLSWFFDVLVARFCSLARLRLALKAFLVRRPSGINKPYRVGADSIPRTHFNIVTDRETKEAKRIRFQVRLFSLDILPLHLRRIGTALF